MRMSISLGYIIEKIDALAGPLIEKGVDIKAILICRELAEDVKLLCKGSFPTALKTFFLPDPVPLKVSSSNKEAISFEIEYKTFKIS